MLSQESREEAEATAWMTSWESTPEEATEEAQAKEEAEEEEAAAAEPSASPQPADQVQEEAMEGKEAMRQTKVDAPQSDEWTKGVTSSGEPFWRAFPHPATPSVPSPSRPYLFLPLPCVRYEIQRY